MLYAGGLFWAARRRPIPDAAAWTAIVLDLGWVVGSVAVTEVDRRRARLLQVTRPFRESGGGSR